jgi:hypothetical protein
MEKKFDAYKLDANESIFFKRQLEYIKAQTYDKKYRDLKGLSLFPVTSEAGPAATEITWRSWDKVGVAKMISDYASDFPRVDIFGTEQTIKVKGLGASYGYSIEEIRRAQMAGVPLEAKRAAMVREVIERKHDSIIWNGDTETGLKGFLAYPGITEYTVPATGTGGTKTWSTKTSDQILTDLNGIVDGILSATNGIEQPDTMLMPLEAYRLISQKRLSDYTEKSVLKYFLENNPYIKRIEWVVELKTAGAGATQRFMVYKNSPSHLEYHMPLPFEMYDADKKAMAFEIPAYSKSAGMVIYFPASVAYGDGI